MPDLRLNKKPVKVYYSVSEWLKDRYGGAENIPPECLGRTVELKPASPGIRQDYKAIPA